jgi:hypothetical protein
MKLLPKINVLFLRNGKIIIVMAIELAQEQDGVKEHLADLSKILISHLSHILLLAKNEYLNF